MSVFVACWVGAYFGLALLVLVGLRRLRRSHPRADAECPSVSIVVSARNEAQDLPAALAALDALDYPAGRWELILVDDRSTDETLSIMETFARDRSHVRVVQSAHEPPTGLEAKARGVACGCALAHGEWILVTDADAIVPPSWARHLLGDVAPDTGLVGGAVVVRAEGLLGVIERVSWAFTQNFAFAAAGWGVPFTTLGPNMGFRRAAYEAAGGLVAAQPRVAEDLAIFRMVTGQRLQARLFLDAETTVTMAPVPSVGHLISQQRRWLGGGMSEHWLYTLGLWLVFGWGAGVALFFLGGWLWSPTWWAVATLARALVDGAALRAQQTRLALRAHLRFLPLTELYVALIFVFLAPSMLLHRRLTWRGTGYVVHYGG